MQEKIPDFQSLEDISRFLKRQRKERFNSLKCMLSIPENKENGRLYRCAVKFENGRLPKKGSSQGPLLSDYLKRIGFDGDNKKCVLDAVYSFSGELKLKESFDTQTKPINLDEFPTGDFPEEFKLDLTEMLKNGEDALVSIEKRHKYRLGFNELVYIAEQVIMAYNTHTSLLSEIFERGRRNGFDKGLIGGTLIGITTLQECMTHDPADLTKHLSPTFNSLILWLDSRARQEYSGARAIKESLQYSNDRYHGERDTLIKEIRGYLSKK